MTANRQIAKNSLFLYVRLLITTIIAVYSSRLILLELGINDFGLYALVGGVVSLFNVMSTTMMSTSNRFLAIEIGKKEDADPNKVFNSLFVIHLFFSILLLFIIETAGVWFLKNQLNIDPDKINDALFVLHLSGITAAIVTINMPFMSLVTIHEKFNVNALAEIALSVLSLAAIASLFFYKSDKLRIYSAFMLSIQMISLLFYAVYCISKYHKIISFRLNKNWSDYNKISRFFGWQMFYMGGVVGAKQGSTLILNMFFGTVLNAAFAVAGKVNEFVFSFVKNINQAALPQILKNYSGDNQERSLYLLYKLSKLTFLIMLVPAVPIMLSIDSILVLWLKEVPAYTNYFVIFQIIHALVSCLESGFDGIIDASGNIRNTKIVFSIIFLSMLPLCYLLFKLNFPPYAITVTFIIGEVFFLLFQTGVLSRITKFKLNTYLTDVILPVCLVSLSIVPLFFLRSLFGQTFSDLVLFSIISVLFTLAIIYSVGLTRAEKNLLKAFFKGKFNGRSISVLTSEIPEA